MSRLAFPCWVRMLLALAAAGWVGLSAMPAHAAGELPAGHPPTGAMPAGHPPTGAMPAGHPPVAPTPAAAIDADAAAVLDAVGAQAEVSAKPVDRAFVVSIVGEPADAIPAGPRALEEKTHAIALLLRCPVCQGSAVADSPASTAVNMKNEVRDLVALGFGQEQILRYFEASYGQFVLMQPKAEGINWLVWLLPGVLVLGGLGLIVSTMRKSAAGRAPASSDVPTRGQLPADAELARYVRQVRELAWGWPGGEPPAKGES